MGKFPTITVKRKPVLDGEMIPDNEKNKISVESNS